MNEPCFYRISVKGIVIDETGRILLSREDNGVWEMLGGGLEHGEEPHNALRREVLEEAGLKITSISEAPAYFITTKRHNRDSYVANVIYLITLENYDFIPSEECQELRFFSLEEMNTIKLFPNVQKLRDVLLNETA